MALGRSNLWRRVFKRFELRQIELVEGHSWAFKGMQEGEHETCAENCKWSSLSGNIEETGGLGMWLRLVLREGSDLNARPRAYPFIVEWCRGRFMWGVLLLSFILTGPYWTSGYLHG